MGFCVGDDVEVCSKEEGFVGSYYVAKILSLVGGEKTFLVEYETLLMDDEKNWLREIIDVEDIRPCPPVVQVSNFDFLDKVDVFDNDGWWVGTITSMEASKCYVYFDCSGDEYVYPYSRLRVHLEWNNGKWWILED